MYVLLKTAYGDFDVPYDTVVAVSYNRDALKVQATFLKEREKEDGVEYYVPKDKVKVL